MSKKSFLSVVASSILTGVVVAGIILAAESTSLLVTVTPGTISVTVSAASYDYGAMPLGSAKSSSSFVVTNNGNVNENFLIKGSDATYTEASGEATKCASTAAQDNCNWALSSAPGIDSYRYTFTPAGGAETNLTAANQTLASNVAPSAATSFALKFYTPTTAGAETALGKPYSTNVTIAAVWAGQ
ncbi:MAG: hypothetical protein HY577_00390 [Candidatus Nealsonbacteria bacterium]|nr:hypothetical protein [Candidatus Nealsonbacteria bacterium]